MNKHNEIVLDLNNTELELAYLMGHVMPLPDGKYIFAMPHGWTFQAMVTDLEEAIQRQESDSGDWVTAKAWRDAKPGLLAKFRAANLKAVNNEQP